MIFVYLLIGFVIGTVFTACSYNVRYIMMEKGQLKQLMEESIQEGYTKALKDLKAVAVSTSMDVRI